MLRKILLDNLLSWLLAIFFVVGGLANLFASDQVRQDYQAWGYPAWFHYVTGVLELTTAALLAFPRTRLVGSTLGAFVMTAAAATVLVNAEYAHALAPLIVLSFVGVDAWLTGRRAR